MSSLIGRDLTQASTYIPNSDQKVQSWYIVPVWKNPQIYVFPLNKPEPGVHDVTLGSQLEVPQSSNILISWAMFTFDPIYSPCA